MSGLRYISELPNGDFHVGISQTFSTKEEAIEWRDKLLIASGVPVERSCIYCQTTFNVNNLREIRYCSAECRRKAFRDRKRRPPVDRKSQATRRDKILSLANAGTKQSEIARLIGVSKQRVNQILKEKRGR